MLLFVLFQNIRIVHLYNDKGIEVDKDGNPVKKGVDIVRLFSLAIPVSFFFQKLPV